MHETFYENMFVDTIVDGDILTPQSNTSYRADTFSEKQTDGGCGAAFTTPPNHSNNAKLFTD